MTSSVKGLGAGIEEGGRGYGTDVGRVSRALRRCLLRCTALRRQWHPTPVFLPGKSHGWGSLVGCSLWGLEESDTTERLHFHFSLSCVGEGNSNPLQCSCLENPRDGRAWWAAVYGFTQSRTRLKRLSSSSSSSILTPVKIESYLKGRDEGFPTRNAVILLNLMTMVMT